MQKLDIVESKSYKNKVLPISIHGKYPYKMYLKIRENNSYDDLIVVVSDIPFDNNVRIDHIVVHIMDETLENKRYKKLHISRPDNENKLIYKVAEISVLDVENTKIRVFERYR